MYLDVVSFMVLFACLFVGMVICSNIFFMFMGVVYEMIQLYSHLSVSIQGSKFSFGFGSPCLLNVNAFEKTIVHHAITDNCVSSTSCTSPVSLP